ncbi:hypothetical protein CIK06_23800 [Plantactinospora sp. KBS50]|nr:hypothetical protein CIK06_23800 [Plantactinospora sp. KBS50]
MWVWVLVGGGTVLALLGLAVFVERPAEPAVDPQRLAAEAAELAEHATTTQREAQRAAAEAVEAAERRAAAQLARDEAWDAQERAEQAFERAFAVVVEGRRAAPAPVEVGPDPQARREVSRAALSAYRRGDISVRELREVWRLTGDHDPAQEEREWTADRLHRESMAARRDYHRAVAELRRVDRAARIAEVAAEALLAEAAESAVEAQVAQDALAATRSRRRWRGGGRSRPGTGPPC